MSNIPKKTGVEYGINPINDLPAFPELPSLKPAEKVVLEEWWRQVRETLKRNNDYIKASK